MTALPSEPLDAPPPAPAAAAAIRARIAEAPEAARWLPAFEADWARALEAARQTFDLSGLHMVIDTWQARLNTAPAVRAFTATGFDDSDSVALEDVIGPRR